MKVSTVFLVFVVASTFLFQNHAIPLSIKNQEQHFYFENFSREVSSPIELIHLLCHKKKVTS
ncbi:hypothetical protein SAMN05660429_01451 [Thalassotalea agarivorans]|uniref:Uncharacterized protein n=1 Tax=Thalassotalea agarivorans TaxID=349064 RepID=A0A1I0DBK1_THASX|nr:hypothetical protein SAMN05660429_01451 [Thalassotalea agarivorans]